MPELPDVEVFRRYLERTALGQPIARLALRKAQRMLGGTDPAGLERSLVGHSLTGGRRHGKHLFAGIGGDGWLALHFGMTGYLDYREGDEADPDHDVLVLFFEGGAHLAFNCRRRLGAIALTAAPGRFVAERGLGPDALDLDEQGFLSRLERRGGSIKGVLMNQEAVAGLGNIYSDEVLFQAGIHPQTPLAALSSTERRALFHAMRKVLQTAIAADADPARLPATFLTPLRGRKGAKCPYCGAAPTRLTVSGRTAWFCPCRQPAPPARRSSR